MIVHDDSYLIWNLLKPTHWHNVIDAFTRKQLASFIHDFVVKLSTSELLLFRIRHYIFYYSQVQLYFSCLVFSSCLEKVL